MFVRDGEDAYVLDSRSKRERRTDFARMRLRSYLPVSANVGVPPRG